MLTSLHTFDNFITSLCQRFTITGSILRALKYTAICIDFLNVFHHELFGCVCGFKIISQHPCKNFMHHHHRIVNIAKSHKHPSGHQTLKKRKHNSDIYPHPAGGASLKPNSAASPTICLFKTSATLRPQLIEHSKCCLQAMISVSILTHHLTKSRDESNI